MTAIDRAALEKKYQDFKARKLALNMTRGKPCPEQLDLAKGMISCLSEDDFLTASGVDCRNYGGLDGIEEAKELFADFMDVAKEEIIIGGNSSLNTMHDVIAAAVTHGFPESDSPWGKQEEVKFLCPVPGYDRHFTILKHFGITMIPVKSDNNGPDMDMVEELVASDETIRGMWVVPKYANPTGVTLSDEVVDRLANMKVKAADFRIMADNAYTVHHLSDTPDRLKNILQACKDAGNPDRVFLFGSTSKVSFAGAGLSFVCGSGKNLEWIRKGLFVRTIGPDKLNQLRHVRFFKSMENIQTHMKKHAAIIKPKFDAVLEMLERELGGTGLAEWNTPNGGYFISLNTLPGKAKKVVQLAAEAGVQLTKAGATYPCGEDPEDSNIRIAPTFPSLDEIKTAMELVCICIKLAD